MCRAKKLNTSINIDNARSSSINSSVNVPAGHQCIRIFHQNGHCLRNKLLEFEAAIDLKENEFDIICLTEDWLKPEEEAFMKISGYTMTAIPEGLCNMVVPVCMSWSISSAMGKSKKRQRSRDNSEGRKLSRHELIKRMERLERLIWSADRRRTGGLVLGRRNAGASGDGDALARHTQPAAGHRQGRTQDLLASSLRGTPRITFRGAGSVAHILLILGRFRLLQAGYFQ
ncbi:unnamed protein product [Callosobruchus maculatus]|uniref:Uncharacterized protein n=1 Tax=Callosobruchus maculatus TaxID=64391 RepID=A0A653CU16_CALMS|nr:unnamed protein product [Callosobruchus maculatus]